jgi:hypothetical protein
MIASCVSEKKKKFKQKFNIFLNVYRVLQYLTVFDSSQRSAK